MQLIKRACARAAKFLESLSACAVSAMIRIVLAAGPQ
jgi:hypothetical protein